MILSSRLVLAVAALIAWRSPGADSVSVGHVTITSLAHLLAQPEQYDGKWVQVMGYYTIGFEDHALFLTKEAAENVSVNYNAHSLTPVARLVQGPWTLFHLFGKVLSV